MERLPKELNEQIFQKLKSIVEIERMTLDERLQYEISLSAERDLSGALEASYEDGEESGIEKGRKEGLEKGKIEGLMEGLCKTARNLKSLGISLTDIVKATGLPLETVQSL